MDYRQFRLSHGVTVSEMVSAVREYAPRYSKVQQSFIEYPERYGICLLPSIDERITERYSGRKPHKTSKPSAKRTKPHRLVVYLDDELNSQFAAIRAKQGCTTQELLKDLIENWLLNNKEEDT